MDLKPYTESDAESSDGEYIPEDDEEEEDDFFEFDDDIEVEDMEVDLDDIWGYDDLNHDEADGSDDPEPDNDGFHFGCVARLLHGCSLTSAICHRTILQRDRC